MTITLYRYDQTTGEYLGTMTPLNDLQVTVYPQTTSLEPPPPKQDYACVFDEPTQRWDYVEDHRGQTVVDIIDKHCLRWDQLGPLPWRYVREVPRLTHLEYLVYNQDRQRWDFDDRRREDCLAKLYSYRCEYRKLQLRAPLVYQEHSYRLSRRQLLELLLALQLRTETTNTLDDEGNLVRLSLTELQELLAACQRRQAEQDALLAEAWAQDRTAFGLELLSKLDELESALVEQYSRGD